MAVFIGRRGWLGIAIEDSPGSPKPPADYLPFAECSLGGKISPVAETLARGVRDEQGPNSQIGKKWGEGTIRTVLDPTLAPYLLILALGSVSSNSLGDGVYEHTITRKADNTPLTASVVFDRVVDRQLFHYLVVSSLELSFADEMVELSADCLSRFPITTASGSLTTTSGTLFTFKHASLKFGDTLSEAENGTELKVREFSLTIENNSETIFTVGTAGDVDEIVHKNFGVSGSFSLLFEDTTQRDIFRNLSKKALILTLTGNGIGGDYSEMVKIKLPRVRYDTYSPDLALDDIASEGIDFVAEYDLNEAKTIEAVIRNRNASYTS